MLESLVDVPDDVKLVPCATACLALDVRPRKLARLLAEAGIPTVQLGERGKSLSVANLRRLVEAHQRPSVAGGGI